MATYASGVKGWIEIPAGADGAASLGAQNVQRWEAEIVREIFDGTVFTDGSDINARKIFGGMHELIGSCQALVDSGAIQTLTHMATEDASPVANFQLWCTGSTTGYTFSGIVGRISIGVEKRGQATITLNFESSGTITRTQAA